MHRADRNGIYSSPIPKVGLKREDMKLTIITGTHRNESKTREVCDQLVDRYAASADVTLLDLKDMPQEAFLPGAYKEKPQAFLPMIDAVMMADGLIVVVPEYNGSYAGVLKHFIDLLPFPDAFEHRPVAFVGLAAGIWGGLRSVEHLQGVFGYRNGYVFPERVFVPRIYSVWDSEKKVFNDPLINELLDIQCERFVRFCKALKESGLSATSKGPSTSVKKG